MLYFFINMAMMKNKKDGFSFIEVAVVVLIIGVLAALAFPSFRIQMMKVKNQEAVRVLMALWEAQLDYYRENGVYAGDINNLDVVIPAMKNFTNLTMTDFPVQGCGGPVVTSRMSVDSLDSSYRIFMMENGKLFCRVLPVSSCPDSLCMKMGFPAQYW